MDSPSQSQTEIPCNSTRCPECLDCGETEDPVWEQRIKTEDQIDYPLRYDQYLALGIYITVIGIAAFIGNSLVISVFSRRKALRTQMHNIFLLNLAISDMGICFIGYPLVGASNYAGRWLFGHSGCMIYAFFTYLFSMGSIATVTVISVYRYIMICKPVFKKKLNWKTDRYCLVGIWIYAITWSVLPFTGWSYYTYEPTGTSCMQAWTDQTPAAIASNVAMAIICFLLPLGIMVFCYYRILKQLTSVYFGNHLAFAGASKEVAIANEIWYSSPEMRRSVLMCVSMVIAFLVSWLPYAVISLISSQVTLPPIVTVFPTMLAKSYPCLNPLIYSFFNSRFRRTVYQLYCCRQLNVVEPATKPFARGDYRYDPETKKAYTMNDEGKGKGSSIKDPITGEQAGYLPNISREVYNAWKEQGDLSSDGEETISVKGKKENAEKNQDQTQEEKQNDQITPVVISIKPSEPRKLNTKDGVYVATLNDKMCKDVMRELVMNPSDVYVKDHGKETGKTLTQTLTGEHGDDDEERNIGIYRKRHVAIDEESDTTANSEANETDQGDYVRYSNSSSLVKTPADSSEESLRLEKVNQDHISKSKQRKRKREKNIEKEMEKKGNYVERTVRTTQKIHRDAKGETSITQERYKVEKDKGSKDKPSTTIHYTKKIVRRAKNDKESELENLSDILHTDGDTEE